MKKQSKKKASTPIVSNDELTRLIKIVLAIVIIVVVFYGLTVLITKKLSKSKYEYNNSNPAVLQYDEIVLGSMLRVPRVEYYVLAVKEKDYYEELYTTYTSLYEGKEASLKIYTSPLDNVFNAKYLAETSQLMVENISELRVKDSTLFHVKDHKIIEVFEGKEQIVSHLKVLSK